VTVKSRRLDRANTSADEGVSEEATKRVEKREAEPNEWEGGEPVFAALAEVLYG
jgi:hypothetical protein